MATMEVFQEDLFMRTGAYGIGTTTDTTLFDNVGWDPRDSGKATYVVALVGTTGYTVTATDNSGYVLCRQFPGGVACP